MIYKNVECLFGVNYPATYFCAFMTITKHTKRTKKHT